MPATQETPQLTIYRNGLVNLNGEATRTKPRWLLAEGVRGDIRLQGRAD